MLLTHVLLGLIVLHSQGVLCNQMARCLLISLLRATLSPHLCVVWVAPNTPKIHGSFHYSFLPSFDGRINTPPLLDPTSILSTLPSPARSSKSFAAAILSRMPSSVGSYKALVIAIAAFGALRAMYMDVASSISSFNPLTIAVVGVFSA